MLRTLLIIVIAFYCELSFGQIANPGCYRSQTYRCSLGGMIDFNGGGSWDQDWYRPTSGIRCWGGNDASCNELTCDGNAFSHFCENDACNTYDYNLCSWEYCHPCPPQPISEGNGGYSLPGSTPNRDGGGN